jgi:hypothetical protein
MFPSKLTTRLRQVALAAMFCLGAASATVSLSENESAAHDAPVTNGLSGYIIAVG